MSTVLSPDDVKKLSQSQLISFVKRGMLKINMLTDTYPTEMTKFETPEYQQFIHLKGIPIGIREASRKYDLSPTTVWQWVNRGFIDRLGMDKNKVLIDEADVAYCAEIRRQNPGAGRWLFNADGTPYSKKC